MEHRLIKGANATNYLPFARSRIRALRSSGLSYASQSFTIDGTTVRVKIALDREYIEVVSSAIGDFWCLSKQFVNDVPCLCVYTLDSSVMKAKRVAALPLTQSEVSAPTGTVGGTTTAIYANGTTLVYRLRSFGAGATVRLDNPFVASPVPGEPYPALMTADYPSGAGDYYTVSAPLFGSFSTSYAVVQEEHTHTEPPSGGPLGGLLTLPHGAYTRSGVDTTAPTMSYKGRCLITNARTYIPYTLSNNLGVGSSPTITSSAGAGMALSFGVQWASGSIEGLGAPNNNSALISTYVARAALVPGGDTTASPTTYGIVQGPIMYGNGKSNAVLPDQKYYISDALSTIDPVTSKYVLRMFAHYQFLFGDGDVPLAKAYDYAGNLIVGAPTIYVPDYLLWSGRLGGASGVSRHSHGRYINVGKKSTVYEWTESPNDFIGAVGHGQTALFYATLTTVFGPHDVASRAEFPWFVPSRPYVVGPDVASMTPYA